MRRVGEAHAHLVVAMALEGEVLGRVAVVNVVDGDPPLDGSQAEALLVGKARDAAGLVLER